MKALSSRRHGAGLQRQPRTSNAGCRATARRPLGSLIDLFEEKSFAILFVLLLGVPALPLPTGGATHVFEIIAALLAVQLIIGREQIWLPERWRRLELAGAAPAALPRGPMKLIRRLERFSKPRGALPLRSPSSNIFFGAARRSPGRVGAFFAPPFTGLDTLPALGVVLLSLGVLLEDIASSSWALSSAPPGSCWRSWSAAPRSRASGSSSRRRVRTDAGEALPTRSARDQAL